MAAFIQSTLLYMWENPGHTNSTSIYVTFYNTEQETEVYTTYIASVKSKLTYCTSIKTATLKKMSERYEIHVISGF